MFLFEFQMTARLRSILSSHKNLRTLLYSGENLLYLTAQQSLNKMEIVQPISHGAATEPLSMTHAVMCSATDLYFLTALCEKSTGEAMRDFTNASPVMQEELL